MKRTVRQAISRAKSSSELSSTPENTERLSEKENLLPDENEIVDRRKSVTKVQEKTAIHYREIGLSEREIAVIMGMNPSTVHSIVKDVKPLEMPKQVEESPGPKSLSEKDLPSASITATTSQIQSQQTTQSQTQQRPAGPVRQSRLEDAMGPLDVEFEHPPPGENQYDDAGKRNWKRLMMMLYGKAFDGKWDTLEEYIQKEMFPKIRYAEAMQELMIPLVAKRDAHGQPDPGEILALSREVQSDGLTRLYDKLKIRKDLEKKFREQHNGTGPEEYEE